MDKASNFGKEYLKILVSEIRVDKKEVHLSGSFSALARANLKTTKLGHLETVPSFVPKWLTLVFHIRTFFVDPPQDIIEYLQNYKRARATEV